MAAGVFCTTWCETCFQVHVNVEHEEEESTRGEEANSTWRAAPPRALGHGRLCLSLPCAPGERCAGGHQWSDSCPAAGTGWGFPHLQDESARLSVPMGAELTHAQVLAIAKSLRLQHVLEAVHFEHAPLLRTQWHLKAPCFAEVVSNPAGKAPFHLIPSLLYGSVWQGSKALRCGGSMCPTGL